MTVRRALLVGIDDYPFGPLSGCVNDARAMQDVLERNEDGSPNFACQVLASDQEQITRPRLLERITALFATEADVALLYFSGHGTENNLDGFLVTPDAARYEEGVSLTQILTLANQSQALEVVIIIDCCNSGHLGNVPATGSNLANIKMGRSILTASRATESAMESNGSGVFTRLVAEALRGGAADTIGNVSVAAIYAYVDESLGPWEQRPLFKAHVSTLIPLRTAAPAVELDILRMFPKWFPNADSELQLDPSFEPTEKPQHDENEALFAKLQKCRAAKLVEPVGEAHLYFAALHSKACRLTALGRHYWNQANSGRI